MTTLIPSDDSIRIKPPTRSGTVMVPSPVVPVVIKAPPSPSIGLLVPVTGAPGSPGPKGDPGGTDYDDIPDLTLLFENGLI